VPQRQDEFEQTAMPHVRSLLRVARRLTSDPEDLVQETMLSAWRGFHQFQPGTNARAWLFRIMMNGFHARVRKARPALVPMEGHDRAGGPDISSAAEVAQALDELAVEHRTVLLLSVVEGFTCQEISGILGVPIGTVMSRLSRAREAMRLRLAPKCSAKEVS
jgi:RNA polymerase sigma-70 factor, ECF subfamily